MKFEKPNMQTVFYIIGAIILYLVYLKNIDPSTPILIVSGILLTFPIVLFTIFAIPKIRTSIKEYYLNQQEKVNGEITDLRKEQEESLSINELIEIDREILSKRESLIEIQKNHFEHNAVKSMIIFISTIFIIYLNLGQYFDIETKYLGIVVFLWGSYCITQMIKDLLIVFND